MSADTVQDESRPRWREHFVFTLSGRVRTEASHYFGPPEPVASRAAARDTFAATQLRAGVRATFAHAQIVFELQNTRLAGLPDDASLAPPFGNLGPGAIYFAHARERDVGTTFVKQGFVTFRHSGFSATAGRFDYSDGLETVPAAPTLAWLKRNRIAERLVGPFGYTHVTRSVDGVRLAYDRPRWNLTALASQPTRGGYDLRANLGLSDVRLGGAALTFKALADRLPSDARVFYLYYRDDRGLLKADNRPQPIRSADRDAIAVHTLGGHVIAAPVVGPGMLDLVAWLAGQRGDWGQLDHRAWAYALEAGYQWPRAPAAPWLRGGINRGAGDRSPGDRRHQSFFQILPTTRVYAQFPFYNLMNTDDRFAQVILRPFEKVTVRSDFRALRLTEAADLWYSGGGATGAQVFGFSGAPSGGRRFLATLVDTGVTVSLGSHVGIAGYYAYAFGGEVVAATFPGRRAQFGYVELTFWR